MTSNGPISAFSDEVDKIVDSWSRQRPDLDTSPMLVLSRISRLARHLDLERRTAFADHDLEPWEFDVLASLRRSGAPFALTPGRLMTELLVSSGTMTNRIDRLEAKGLVERSRESNDRRSITVTLTDKGRDCVDGALMTLLACEQRILSPLSESELELLGNLLRPLLLPFE
ncbi:MULTISPECIES: MarR family winged helix-turn-helix transcriptional regulator [unclassified Schaalia]|uniref:MarR family winged helix-turn-helix transcriptional regulator n=1 Tax=unclassified Schaalia TaxID=2691889 RepID=UPI001E503100|nr:MULTISPECIES: MarR family transcriptional regulator [unclassified Schaalia]MCD4549058.1 MarR family transcriptional regulator [Schaalia sp. lx-260]MCD4557246.1 MarR family transcriptional regulator [Schaalia sp. lx-100]